MSREAFKEAAGFLLEVLDRVPPDKWAAPGLGVWNVRELASHATRSMTNVEIYSKAPAKSVDLEDGAAYFVKALEPAGISESIAERTRQFSRTLGDDLPEDAKAIYARVRGLLETLPDSLIVTTQVGGMRLLDYLSTRTFEIVIHSIDLTDALELDLKPPPLALAETAHLMTEIGLRRGRAVELLMASAGRRSLPPGFCLLDQR
jgi:uncharacterized protein (TIGR03083 family)